MNVPARRTTVLIVEDDDSIAKIIAFYLKNEGFATTHVRDADGLFSLESLNFDIILLDIMLPGASGFDICFNLRQKTSSPIIFISALDDSDSIVKALDMGGDDYLPKPFDRKVLIARIKANLRRADVLEKPDSLPERISIGGAIVNTVDRTVTRAGKTSKLTNIEFRLLSFLLFNPGRFYSSAELYRNVWGHETAGDSRTVLVHIRHLRQKLEDDASSPRHLVQERGHGYALFIEEQPRCHS